jgi:hypothetical protein
MGFGDEIMVTGEAVRLGCSAEKPLVVLGKNGRPITHQLWANNPRFKIPDGKPVEDHYVVIRNHGGWRPYVVYASRAYRAGIANQTADRTATTKDRWIFSPTWRATPGELYIKRHRPAGYVVVEPHTKNNTFAHNKRWPWPSWQRMVDILRSEGCDVVQLGPPGTQLLSGARLIATGSFLRACEALAAASGAILPEGGLHHAAAALDIFAVVLFGRAGAMQTLRRILEEPRCRSGGV